MTPRRGIGFLRSLLGQEEEESEERNEGTAARHPSTEETPGLTVTRADEARGDILETESEVPAATMADHDVDVPEGPRVIRTELPDEPAFSQDVPVETPAPVQAPAPRPPVQPPARPPPDPPQVAIAQLKAPAVERRRAALRSLSLLEMSPAAYAAVAGALQDPEHDVRSLALRVLERDPAHAPLDAISGAALDADPGIRARAMALLGRSGNAAVLPSLIDRIGGEEDEAVVGAALGGVARLLSSIDPTHLAQYTAENVSRSVAGLSPLVRSRFRREVGLIAVGFPESWIIDGLGSADSSLRRGMAILGSERGSAHALNALARLTADDDGEVRDLAIDAQSKATFIEPPATHTSTTPFGTESESNGFDNELEQVTIPVLMTALKDPQPAVRERAEAALRVIKPARIASWLVPQITAAEAEEAAHLADIALRLNIAEAVPPLVDHVLELEPGLARERLSSVLRGFSGIDELIASWQSDPDGERRVAAIRLAGLVGSTGSSGIDAGLRDPSATVRLASIEAAGSDLSGDTGSSLIATLSSDSSTGVRLAAARAFLGAGLEDRVRVAEVALRDTDREVRRTGVELLSGASGGETSLLVTALQDTDQEIAGRAATVLSQAPGPEALATLWNALRSTSTDVRQTIIDALLSFGPDVLGRLAAQAYESTDSNERALGLAMLVRLGNGGSHELLIDSLSDPSTDVRAEALAAIIGRPDAMDIDAVGARVRDPHAQVRALAVSALASVDDDRSLPYLLDASQDPVEEVRSSARGVILERRSSSVAQMLINALGTPNLRRTSAELLTQMGEVATDALVGALVGADPDLKRIIGETLSSSGAAENLIKELSGRSVAQRERAIDALGAMRAPHAVDALIARLEDPDGTVRSKAAEVLGDLGDVRAVEPLKRVFVADPDMDVVAATERSLRKLTGPPSSGGTTES